MALTCWLVRGPFQATQWNTHGDHEAVRPIAADNVGEEIDRDTHGILNNGSGRIVRPGDWIIESRGSLDVVSDSDFERDYQIDLPTLGINMPGESL